MSWEGPDQIILISKTFLVLNILPWSQIFILFLQFSVFIYIWWKLCPTDQAFGEAFWGSAGVERDLAHTIFKPNFLVFPWCWKYSHSWGVAFRGTAWCTQTATRLTVRRRTRATSKIIPRIDVAVMLSELKWFRLKSRNGPSSFG